MLVGHHQIDPQCLVVPDETRQTGDDLAESEARRDASLKYHETHPFLAPRDLLRRALRGSIQPV